MLNDLLSLSEVLSLEVAKEHILLNHSYSLEPMFMYCQNSAGSWGRNFVGNWFVAALHCKTIHYFVLPSWGCKLVGKDDPRNLRTKMIPKYWKNLCFI